MFEINSTFGVSCSSVSKHGQIEVRNNASNNPLIYLYIIDPSVRMGGNYAKKDKNCRELCSSLQYLTTGNNYLSQA